MSIERPHFEKTQTKTDSGTNATREAHLRLWHRSGRWISGPQTSVRHELNRLYGSDLHLGRRNRFEFGKSPHRDRCRFGFGGDQYQEYPDIEDTPDFGTALSTGYILGMVKTEGSVKILLCIDQVLNEDCDAVVSFVQRKGDR
jgi:hypothetical protein